jgi:hypothetical protein
MLVKNVSLSPVYFVILVLAIVSFEIASAFAVAISAIILFSIACLRAFFVAYELAASGKSVLSIVTETFPADIFTILLTSIILLY